MSEEIKECPNYECHGRIGNMPLVNWTGNIGQVWCGKCGLLGPASPVREEAIRLWNALPRHEVFDAGEVKPEADGFYWTFKMGEDDIWRLGNYSKRMGLWNRNIDYYMPMPPAPGKEKE